MSLTVFIFADGQVGLRDLNAHHAGLYVYREPVPQPRSVQWYPVAVAPEPMSVREFIRRGRMFDGRPIFCEAPRWRAVRQARMSLLTGLLNLDANRAVAEIRAALRRFIHDAEPDAIILDEDKQTDVDKTTQSERITLTWQFVSQATEAPPSTNALDPVDGIGQKGSRA